MASDEKILLPLQDLRRKNVVGYSTKLKKKISKRKLTDIDSIRVYVTNKAPTTHLYEKDILPKEIDGIPVDVIDVGGEFIIHDRRNDYSLGIEAQRMRHHTPLWAGVSIGNFEITAGTLGWFFEKDGEILLGSNAHVFTEDASLDVPLQKKILQPAVADKGTQDDIMATYVWHEKMLPEIDDNGPFNYQDFAVARPFNNITFLDDRTFSFFVKYYNYIGILFAGSFATTIISKAKYQIGSGYTPHNVNWADDVKYHDRLYKTGRTTGYKSNIVLDADARVKINYRKFYAWHDDVIMAWNMSAGGDSGSSVWKHKNA